MRILMTGGTGVLGRASKPLLADAGHEVDAPGSSELDLFDSSAVRDAVAGHDAVLHLATKIPPPPEMGDEAAWQMNSRLRAEATPLLVDAAVAAGAKLFVFPSIAFVYEVEGSVDEDSPLAREIMPAARTAIDAEEAVARFAGNGGRGVSLRMGLLFGPTTGNDDGPPPWFPFPGATLHIDDAGSALAAAVDADVPSGIYNVTRDGERVSNARFKSVGGWRPTH
jgi:nucleoside-diphosphate-sugar epimerase